MTSPSVFISYSHKDEEWKDRLVTHLRVLQMEGLLDVWEDRRIEAGSDWYPEIENAINTANVAILMISANFLTSNFILGKEVPTLLRRREKEGVRVIPIIVKPCAWTQLKWLSKIQARPKDGRALSSGTENQIDIDLASIAEEIAQLAESNLDMEHLSRLDWDLLEMHQRKSPDLEQKIKRLIKFGEYEKAIEECNSALSYNLDQPLINILMVVATLKGKGADRFQTKTIKRLENHLSKACDDPNYYATALVIWGLIKHDHYELNALHQEKPTLGDIKKALVAIDLDQMDLNLIEQIRASQKAYGSLSLKRFFWGDT